MARSSLNTPQRRRPRPRPTGQAARGLGSGAPRPGPAFRRQPPARFGWTLAALALLLVGGALLVFNQHHSGDALKIRRELRKF